MDQALAKFYGQNECDPRIGCLPQRPDEHQPLQNLLIRNVSEFAKRGDDTFVGPYNNGPICAYDDDMIKGEPQNIYYEVVGGNSAIGPDGKTYKDVFRLGYCDGKLTVMKSNC